MASALDEKLDPLIMVIAGSVAGGPKRQGTVTEPGLVVINLGTAGRPALAASKEEISSVKKRHWTIRANRRIGALTSRPTSLGKAIRKRTMSGWTAARS